MMDKLCAYCDLHADREDFALKVPICLHCLKAVLRDKPTHATVEERRAWVRAVRQIPENNVTVISRPWEPRPFKMRKVKKWTYQDRQRLKR